MSRVVSWVLLPTVALAATQPAGSPPPSANIPLTTDDIKAVRQACEPNGKFVHEAPVVTPEKRGMLDCRALYQALNLPIPAIPAPVTAVAQSQAPARQSRMDLDSCLPPDPVGALMPKVNIGEETFGKLGTEEDEEACRKAADENRGTLLGDLGCMVLRDALRLGTAVPGASAAGGAATAAGAAAGTAAVASAAGGVAAGTIAGEGLLGVAEWIANKVKPDQSCITTKKSSCISGAIAGIINNLIFNIKGIWELVKLPFKAIGSLFSSTTSVEDSMADKKLEASKASPEEATSFLSDPTGWFNQKIAQIWAAIVHEVTHNYGCREWSGSATLGQMGMGTCVKPWVCFEAASADQVMSAACGVVGFLGGEAISAYFTMGAIKFVGEGASLAGKTLQATADSNHALAGAAKATLAATSKAGSAAGKVGEVVGNTVFAVANSIPGRIVLFFNPLKLPGISHYIRWIGSAGEAGAAAAGRAFERMSEAVKATRAGEAAGGASGVTASGSATPAGTPPATTPGAVSPSITYTRGGYIIGNEAGNAEEIYAAILEYEKEAVRLQMEAIKYGDRARKWKYGQWFAENRRAVRFERIQKLAEELKTKYGIKVDLGEIKAQASLEEALAELGAKEKGVILRTGDEALDNKLAKLQARYDKIVNKLGSAKIDADRWRELRLIEAEIDSAVGQKGTFAKLNVERYHLEASEVLKDDKLIAKLYADGGEAVWGTYAAEETVLESMGRFLNARGIRFEVAGQKGAREIQLLDEAGKPISGKSFKIRGDNLKACVATYPL